MHRRAEQRAEAARFRLPGPLRYHAKLLRTIGLSGDVAGFDRHGSRRCDGLCGVAHCLLKVSLHHVDLLLECWVATEVCRASGIDATRPLREMVEAKDLEAFRERVVSAVGQSTQGVLH